MQLYFYFHLGVYWLTSLEDGGEEEKRGNLYEDGDHPLREYI